MLRMSEIIEQALCRHPGLPALTSGNVTYDYTDLHLLSQRVIARLSRSARPGQRAVIVGDHSLASVVWAIATLRSGLIYTPVHALSPVDRLSQEIRCAKPAVVVCFDEELAGTLRRLTDAEVIVAGPLERIAADAPMAPTLEDTREPIAYSIFTSGSTGEPKLVDVGHRGLEPLCRAQTAAFGLRPGLRVLQFSSLAFDASISELVATLYAGATIVVPDRTDRSWLGAVNDCLLARQCDLATLPPSVYARLAPEAVRTLSTVVFAGEALTEPECERALKHARVLNAYGPTEGTVCFSIAEVIEHVGDIGTPIDGYGLRIFDAETGRYADAGTGELVIVGPGVALGYHGDGEATASRFRTIDDAPAYHTGDLVSYANGRLSYIGRTDDQIKRLGHRVNLTGLETRFSQGLGFRVAILVAGGRLVLAHVDGPGEAEIMARLRRLAPMWELPDLVVRLDAMPLTVGGKADKNAITCLIGDEHGRRLSPDAVTEPDMTDFDRVRGIAEELLGQALDPDASVYDAGGGSLTLVSLQVRLGEHYGEEVVQTALEALDYDFTVNGFVAALNGGRDPGSGTVASVVRAAEKELDAWHVALVTRRAGAEGDRRRVLITGASGFVGGRVLDRALDVFDHVYVATTGVPEALPAVHAKRWGRGSEDYRNVHVVTFEELGRAAENGELDFGAVIHCGYEVNHLLPLERQVATNVAATKQVALAASSAGAGKFAFLSAASSGALFDPVTVERVAAVPEPYSQSKLLCEMYLDELTRAGCAVDVHRMSLVYGHGPQEGGFLRNDKYFQLLRHSRKIGALPRLVGGLPVCDVRTVVDRVVTGLAHPEPTKQIIVDDIYDLERLAHAIGIGAADVLEFDQWCEAVSAAGVSDPRWLAAIRAAGPNLGPIAGPHGLEKGSLLEELMRVHGNGEHVLVRD